MLIALWSLCILTVFAVYLGYGVRQKIMLIGRLNSRDSLHFIADAGVKQAIAELRKKEPSGYDALNEAWSNNPDMFKEVSVSYGEFNVCYDYLDYPSGKPQIRYGLIDEERKINLNMSDLNTIQRLIMIVAGLDGIGAQNLAAAIVDWRDSDSALSIPLGSAEDRYYQNLPVPYEAKDADFEVLDELLLIKGMSQELLEKLKNYITIYSNGKININTAPAEVLLALDLNNRLVDKILSFRSGKDKIEATDDDNIFSSPATVVEQLSSFSELSPEEEARLGSLVSFGKISTDSGIFMVRSKAKLDRQESEVTCTVNREGKILSWKEE